MKCLLQEISHENIKQQPQSESHPLFNDIDVNFFGVEEKEGCMECVVAGSQETFETEACFYTISKYKILTEIFY